MAFPKPDVGKWGAEAKVEDMLQCSMVTRGCPLLLPEKAGNMAVSHSEDRGGGGGGGEQVHQTKESPSNLGVGGISAGNGAVIKNKKQKTKRHEGHWTALRAHIQTLENEDRSWALMADFK